jgi:hypothetical protein
MSAVDSVRRPVCLTVLLLAAVTLAADRKPTVIRVSDAVGDTIDLAERDSFRLFPNTAGFQHATIIEIPKPEIQAEVTLADGDSTRRVFFRLVPSQLERIRFLVDNRDLIEAQLISDTSAASTLATFWRSIEEQPLRDTSGVPAPAGNDSEPQVAATTPSDSLVRHGRGQRFDYTVHGATIGSAAGGCIGSHAAIRLIRVEEAGCLCPSHGVYYYDPGVFWGASCGATALGMGAGYALGSKLDRSDTIPMRRLKESTNWRAGMALGGFVVGAAAGFGTFMLTATNRYGVLDDVFDVIENDPDDWTILPMAFTGLCIAVEGATIGYRIGREIDRRKAEEAEARSRALGRRATP